MWNHRKKNYRHKRLHVAIPVIIGVVLVSSGIVAWNKIERVNDQQAVVVEPGEFPVKKVAVMEAAETAMEEPKTTAVEKTEAEVLSNEEAQGLTVVVNKKHRLSSDYYPTLQPVRGSQLRPEAAAALEQLLVAAENAGHSPKIVSAFRSYSTQVSTYNGYVARDGQELADTYSARPGHSEHQTGLAVDLGNSNGDCELQSCFGQTAFGEWLKVNSSSYGFIIRYPEGKDAITGYQYEPWHLRYLGNDSALAVQLSGKTMDEYYNVSAGGY